MQLMKDLQFISSDTLKCATYIVLIVNLHQYEPGPSSLHYKQYCAFQQYVPLL